MTEPTRPLSAHLRAVLTVAREKALRRRNDMTGLEPVEVFAAAVVRNDPAVTPLVEWYTGNDLVKDLLDCPPIRDFQLPQLVSRFADPTATGEVTVVELLLGMVIPESGATQLLDRLAEMRAPIERIERYLHRPDGQRRGLASLLTADGRMELDEFATAGYLQEINRLFLHPRGLAMAIGFDDGKYVGPVTILDARQDPEGWIFEGDLPSADKAVVPQQDYDRHLATRRELFGTDDGIQPLR